MDSLEHAGHAILMENFDKDYNVTQEEMLEYAQEIGINCATESELLWIAWEGVMAPLPADWTAIEAEDKVYYRNATNGTTTWEHPCDSYYRDLVIKERRQNRLENGTSNEDSPQYRHTKERGEPQGSISNATLEETKSLEIKGVTLKRNVHFVDSESVSEYDEWKRSNRRLSLHSQMDSSKDSLDVLDESDLDKCHHLIEGESSISGPSVREGSGASERGSFTSKDEKFDLSVASVFKESRNALRKQQAEDFKKYEEMLRNELKENKERLVKELEEVIEQEKAERERMLRCQMDQELETLKLKLEEDKAATEQHLKNEHVATLGALRKTLNEERDKLIKDNASEIRVMLRVLKETNNELKTMLEDDARKLKEEYKAHLYNLRREQREELERLSKEYGGAVEKETSKNKTETSIGVQGVRNETDVSSLLQNSANEDGSCSEILNFRISKLETCLERYQKRIEKLENLAESGSVSVSSVNRKRISKETTSDVSMISQQSQGLVDKRSVNLSYTDGDDDNVFARMESLQQRTGYHRSTEDFSKDDHSDSTTTTSSTDGTGSSLESASVTGSSSFSRPFGSMKSRVYNMGTSYTVSPMNYSEEVRRINRAPFDVEGYNRDNFPYGLRNMVPSTSNPYEENDWQRYRGMVVTKTEDMLRRQKEWLKGFPKLAPKDHI